MSYKLEKTFERMHRLLEMRESLEQIYIPNPDNATTWGDDDGYYPGLNEAYEKFYTAFYTAFDELIANEAARIKKLVEERTAADEK